MQLLELGPEATYVNKETQIFVEDNLEQRQVCTTTHLTLKDDPLEKQLEPRLLEEGKHQGKGGGQRDKEGCIGGITNN